MKLDLAAKVATLVKSVDQPEGLVAAAEGNAQTTRNGDLFVGWGALPYISEFSPSGQLLFNARAPGGRHHLPRLPPALAPGQLSSRDRPGASSMDTGRCQDQCRLGRDLNPGGRWPGGGQGEQLIRDHAGRRRTVQGGRAGPEHLRLEHGPALPDLPPAGLAAARRMQRIIGGEPGLLGRAVNTEQEHPAEQVQQLVLVPGYPGCIAAAKRDMRSSETSKVPRQAAVKAEPGWLSRSAVLRP